MQQDDVANAARDLDKIAALLDQAAKVELAQDRAFRVIPQVAGHRRHGIAGHERSPALMRDIRPEDQGEQSLLRTIQEMPEEPAILVPAGRLRGGRLPGLVGANVKVDNEPIAE